jgi:bifunctional enzyme CysN/CysC
VELGLEGDHSASADASAVEERLVMEGRHAFLLDGENLRHGLNGDLAFDEAARGENVPRTAHVARLLAESGTLALVSLLSPYAQDREAAVALHAAVDLPFIEVFVDAPLQLCEQRDPQGLYARTRRVLATTVLKQHPRGSRTYKSCTKSSGIIKLHGGK